MKKALLFCSCLFICFAAIARDNNTPTPQSFANKKAPLSFMENKGAVIQLLEAVMSKKALKSNNF